MQNVGVTNKEYYGMLWYFLEWSIQTLWEQVVLFQEFPYHLNVNAA